MKTKAVFFLFLLCALALRPTGAQAQTCGPGKVSPRVGVPLEQAQAAMKAGQWGEALSKIGVAEAQPQKTPLEACLVGQMKAVAAARASNVRRGEPSKPK